MTDISGTIAFTYDDWGRTISKSRGGLGAAYAYKYGSKLQSVTSTMYDEGNVTHNYRADGKRHARTAGGVTTRYNWDAGWNVVSEQTVSSTLTRTYIGSLAHVDGTTPASGAYLYYMHDNLGSTRVMFNQSKAITAGFEYDPYGGSYGDPGPSHVTHRFTGHTWDSQSQLYFAPYRYYSAAAARWMTRDPSGMMDGPNVYAYLTSNPIRFIDKLGDKKHMVFKWPTKEMMESDCWQTYQQCGLKAATRVADTLNAAGITATMAGIVFCLLATAPTVVFMFVCGATGLLAVADILSYYIWLRPTWKAANLDRQICAVELGTCLKQAGY